MPQPWRDRIGAAFSGAHDYDRHARVQARVARRLAERVGALDLPEAPRVLEIGCGTGFLTEALIAQGIGGDLLVTDLSPAMVERCRARVGEAPGRRFAVLDGEQGARPEQAPFDLIVSSLTFQWFDDQAAAVARLMDWLAPGGRLVFTTLAAGTFAEWRAAHAAEGLAAGTPGFPSAADLGTMHPMQEMIVERECEAHGSAREFLRALKAIGAGTAAARHRPLGPGALRRVMARFERAGASATYEVVTCHCRKAAK